MTTGLLTTTAGRNAIIADLGGGADLVLTHVAWGDANGVPYNPNEAQTVLVNEKYRAPIASVAVVGGAIVVDAVIPADTNDGNGRPSHGFNVAEVGLISAAGTLIGVARCGNGYKPPPSSGQAADVTYRLKLAVANPSAIAVTIDPVAQVSAGRQIRPFWLTVDGIVNDPPGAPAVGATYIVGAAPTGAWAGFAHRLAQWVGVWALASAPEGHVVNDRSKAENHAQRFLKRTAAGWYSAAASQTAYGVTRQATAAEIASGAGVGAFVGPDQIVGVGQVPTGALPWPEVFSADHAIAISVGSKAGSGGYLTTAGGEIIEFGQDKGGGLALLRRSVVPAVDFGQGNANTLPINSTIYLRAQFDGAGNLTIYQQRGTDADAEPGGLLGTPNAAAGGGFDSTRLDVLLAKVVTGAAGSVPTLTRLANAARLVAYGEKQSPTLGVTTSWASGNDSVIVNTNAYVRGLFEFVLNWARKPVVRIPSGFVWVQNAAQIQYLSATSNVSTIDTFDRSKIVGKVESDYVDGQAWVTGTLQWSAWFVGMRVLAEA